MTLHWKFIRKKYRKIEDIIDDKYDEDFELE